MLRAACSMLRGTLSLALLCCSLLQARTARAAAAGRPPRHRSRPPPAQHLAPLQLRLGQQQQVSCGDQFTCLLGFAHGRQQRQRLFGSAPSQPGSQAAATAAMFVLVLAWELKAGAEQRARARAVDPQSECLGVVVRRRAACCVGP